MLIVCCACHGRKMVSPLGGMPLPCAICKGIGYAEDKPITNKSIVESIPPANPVPDITLQVKPKIEDCIKIGINSPLGKKRTTKRAQIREALNAIGREG